MDSAPEVSLITIRVGREAASPNDIFVSLRRYPIPGNAAPEDTVEEVSAEEAIAVVTRWLDNLDGTR